MDSPILHSLLDSTMTMILSICSTFKRLIQMKILYVRNPDTGPKIAHILPIT